MSGTPKIFTEDATGSSALDKDKAAYHWGQNKQNVVTAWKRKAKLPQLETLIELFNGTDIAIAGGAVLASLDAVEYTDIDVFPLTLAAVDEATNLLVNIGYKETEENEHFLLYERPGSSSRPVQVVLLHTDTGNVHTVIDRFDITVCQVAVLNKKLHSNTVALEDIRRRNLRVSSTLNISALMVRLSKYNKRGYSAIDGQPPKEKKSSKRY